MSRPPLELADIVRCAGQAFLEHSRKWINWQHRKVLLAITRCRTAALGGHRDRCTGCGHTTTISYNFVQLVPQPALPKVPGQRTHSRRYRLPPTGYSVCLIFLKLFERIYSPLTAGLLSPLREDRKLQHTKRSQLDRLYQRVIDDLDSLIRAVGL